MVHLNTQVPLVQCNPFGADLTPASNEHETLPAFAHLLQILNTCTIHILRVTEEKDAEKQTPLAMRLILSAHTIALYRLCPDDKFALPNRARCNSRLRENFNIKHIIPLSSFVRATCLSKRIRYSSCLNLCHSTKPFLIIAPSGEQRKRYQT